MLTGPDCSRHQGTVVWSAVRAAGHTFAIIKATEGTGYSYVGWYRDNAPRVKAAGLTLGAYAFLRTGDGAAQARYYVSTVGDFGGVLAVLDVETAANGSKPTIADVREFVAEFRRLVPGHPLAIYTGRWYWVGVMGNPHGADLGPLWHSEYESSPASGPDLDNYGGWAGATLWQWTSSGSCPGVSGRCDLNVFYGTHDDLAVLCGAKAGGGPIPKPPTTPINVQEDDMEIISSQWTGQAVIAGGTVTWLDDPAEVQNLVNQGVPVRTFVTESNVRRFLTERGANVNELILEQERAQTLYAAATSQIEGREEQRDLADG